MPNDAQETSEMPLDWKAVEPNPLGKLRGLIEAREVLRGVALMYDRNEIVGRDGKAMSTATAAECRQALAIVDKMLVRRMEEAANRDR
jgi:hypothetical protein